MEAIKNIALILLKPSKVCAWIKKNPNWWIPASILIVVSIIFTVVSTPLSLEVAQQQLLGRSSEMPPEQYDRTMQMLKSPIAMVIAAATTLIGMPLALLIQAGVLHLVISLFGSNASFRIGFAIVSFAQAPIIIRSIVLSIYSLASSRLVKPGFSAILPDDHLSSPLGVFLARIDIFSIWSMVILAIGLSIAYRISKKKSGAIILGYWLVSTAFAVLFSLTTNVLGAAQ